MKAKSTTNSHATSSMKILAAALMASTLVAGTVVIQTLPAFSQKAIEAIDPTKGFSSLVEHVMPAVVSVEVKFEAAASRERGDSGGDLPPQMREFFEQFPQFRDRFQNPRGRTSAVGSGFVITADGYVVTNNHVVSDATMVKLRFQSGEEFDAKVIGTDSKTDLALLKIDADKALPFVPFAEADTKVGDWVMAVGNPFGLGGTVTAGIVSARGRDIGSGPYDDYLQIDASINKGNSGGPAFNMKGEVIGVNTAIFSPSGGSVGIGFAIPTSLVKQVVEDLKGDGVVTRGFLGVQIQPVTDEIAEGLGLDKAEGAIVSNLTPSSPAEKAGIQSGDIVVKANGEMIDDAKDLSRTVAGLKPGQSIPFEIIREGKRQTIDVEIGTMPGDERRAETQTTGSKPVRLSDLGIEIEPSEEGVKITELDPASAAASKGLRPGDVILEIAGRDVKSPNDIEMALKAATSKSVLMLVRSGDNQRFIALPRTLG
jgi:serine protease Do